ncbi:MAG TPA: copper resistance protein CopC [Rubrobacter sp.]|nr:copper resistance protein CopC [Rubrobacter sp.]
MAPVTGIGRLPIALWLSVAWVLLSSVPALAHANLVGSFPSAGLKSSTPPEQVRLRFNEPVDAEFDPVVVRDSEGDRVDEGDARVDPEDARVVLADLEKLPEGSYTVEWRVTSIDGHVVEGRYGFAVTGGSGDERPNAEERAGQADREPATQGGRPDGSVPILTYSALSLGLVAAVVAAALLLTWLVRRRRP